MAKKKSKPESNKQGTYQVTRVIYVTLNVKAMHEHDAINKFIIHTLDQHDYLELIENSNQETQVYKLSE